MTTMERSGGALAEEPGVDQMTVLLVDDHPSFLAAARLLLEADGFHIVGEALDGLSAVAVAERLRPDLVLLDIQLPDIDGFEVARRLHRLPTPPVVVLTSSREAAQYGSRVSAAPASGFIPKHELSGDRLAALAAGPPYPDPAPRID